MGDYRHTLPEPYESITVEICIAACLDTPVHFRYAGNITALAAALGIEASTLLPRQKGLSRGWPDGTKFSVERRPRDYVCVRFYKTLTDAMLMPGVSRKVLLFIALKAHLSSVFYGTGDRERLNAMIATLMSGESYGFRVPNDVQPCSKPKAHLRLVVSNH